MLALITAFLVAIRAFFRSRVDTSLEVLALRQQVAVLKAAATLAKPLGSVLLDYSTQIWPRWSDVLVIVKPETVIRWHRAGFRLYWRWRSRPRGGRPRVSEEVHSPSPHGSGEHGLGRTEDSRGTAEAPASNSASAQSPDICNACGAAAIRPNAGSPSSLTIVR